MEWLNYHHLLYFYTVAREGSVRRASEVLRLAQPTLSGQIRKLEEALGEPLLERDGRGLKLTPNGRLVFEYAETIFSTGQEMLSALRTSPAGPPARLVVGITDVVPKLIAYRLLETALDRDERIQFVIQEGKTDDLVAGLAVQRFDLVLTDSPLGPQSRVKAFNHPLGQCGVGFFARADVAESLEGRFPACLDGAPMLYPALGTRLRRSLDRWFERIEVRPRLVAEIEDSALVKVFAAKGRGVFAAPMPIERDICATYDLELIGQTASVTEKFYAITAERRIANPIVTAIAERAKTAIFE